MRNCSFFSSLLFAGSVVEGSIGPEIQHALPAKFLQKADVIKAEDPLFGKGVKSFLSSSVRIKIFEKGAVNIVFAKHAGGMSTERAFQDVIYLKGGDGVLVGVTTQIFFGHNLFRHNDGDVGGPGDLGIGSDARVLLFEDFEVPNKAALGKRWEQMSDKDGEVLALVADHPPGSLGTNALEVTARLGRNTGGDLYRRLPRSVDRAFARFLVRFDEANGYTHHFVHFGGYHPSTPWAQGGAGVRPAGDERFTVGVEPFGENGRFQPPGAWFLYTYWQEMKASADGKYWGNGLRPARPFPVPKSRWQCLEVMIQLNSRPETSDGELAFWVDGHLAAHFAPGTRRGPWTGIGFTQAAEGGEPFEGFRWRKSTDLRINFFWLLDYVTDSAARQNHLASPPEFNRVRFDHVVVAEDYIGPILPAP